MTEAFKYAAFERVDLLNAPGRLPLNVLDSHNLRTTGI